MNARCSESLSQPQDAAVGKAAKPATKPQVFAPGATATVELDALEALQCAQSMRAMARDRSRFMPEGQREIFTRLGAQLRSAALVAMATDNATKASR